MSIQKPVSAQKIVGADISPLGFWQRHYAMSLLLIIYIFNMADRLVLSIVAEPIKTEFRLHDWQIGLMAGTAFAVFYAVMGIPIARLAERRNRIWIIAGSLALWSGFTMLCGLTQTAWQLIMARVGVGVGEAGCNPPAHSLISDYVAKERRSSALAFYAMGGSLGAMIGKSLGGTVADAYGWRAAFLVCGAPGLLLAVLVLLTLPEPRRAASPAATKTAPKTSFRDVLRVLSGKPTYWYVVFAASLKAFISFGISPFLASFFLRNHGPEVARLAESFGLQSLGFLGLALGVGTGLAGAAGAWVGGVIADRLVVRNLKSFIGMPALATLATIPLTIVALTTSSVVVSLVCLAAYSFLVTLWYGAGYSSIQGVVAPHMRATAASLMFLMTNLIGLGLGPFVIGLLSDSFSAGFGVSSGEGLRWALMSTALVAIVVAGLFWAARRTIEKDLVS